MGNIRSNHYQKKNVEEKQQLQPNTLCKNEAGLLRPPAGRQYGMSISQQPFNRSLPYFQQLLLMSNEGEVESFSSFAYG